MEIEGSWHKKTPGFGPGVGENEKDYENENDSLFGDIKSVTRIQWDDDTKSVLLGNNISKKRRHQFRSALPEVQYRKGFCFPVIARVIEPSNSICLRVARTQHFFAVQKYCRMIGVSQRVGIVLISLLVGRTGLAKDDRDIMPGPPLVLPSITVTTERLNPSWLLPRRVLTPPGFKGVPAELVYPTRALHEGHFEGRAVVGVMLDREGHPVDFLILKYSRRYFADELLRVLQQESFTPRRFRGVAVSGRFNLAQRFYVGGAVQMTPLDAMAEFTRRITYRLDGGAPYEFEACLEGATDSKGLHWAVPPSAKLSDDFVLPEGKAVKAVVSFYVDETGRARLPNVESDTVPELAEAVIRMVSAWRFEPPTVKGRPALVLAIRSIEIGARPPDQSSTPAGSIAP